MSDLSDIYAGMKHTLETANPALRVYTEPPDGVLEYPCLLLEPSLDINYDIAMGGNSIEATIRATVYVHSASSKAAFQEVQKYISPTGTESIRAGLLSDPTLNGAVGDSRLLPNVQVTRDRDDNGHFWEVSARFQIRVLESIA